MQLTIRRLSRTAVAVLAALCLLSAQRPPRGHMRMYDPATETTIKGAVDEVSVGARGMMGTHLAVKSGDQLTTVMLGPADFIAAAGFAFAKGDAVEITGSKVRMGGQDFVIAREAVKDGKILTLRDQNGTPKWARGMTAR